MRAPLTDTRGSGTEEHSILVLTCICLRRRYPANDVGAGTSTRSLGLITRREMETSRTCLGLPNHRSVVPSFAQRPFTSPVGHSSLHPTSLSIPRMTFWEVSPQRPMRLLTCHLSADLLVQFCGSHDNRLARRYAPTCSNCRRAPEAFAVASRPYRTFSLCSCVSRSSGAVGTWSTVTI
ncbi:hypothetical protein PLICRDRAFT_284682 [Plicaturopsis crispa FD-325 SS-3]|nr:hypothetical protein PLICRDRAFT_284682 [Plicaturopsis crispa FD-325 SS-3]